MNIKGGALEFDIIANNSQLNKALEESKRRIQGVSDALVETGETLDTTTQEIVECIDIQKKVIGQLEEEVRKLDTQFEELGPGQGQQDILDQANKIKQELEGEKEALVVLEKELENAAISASGFGQAFEEAEKTIDNAFRDIDSMADTHKAAINSLEKEYAELGTASAAAFMKGTAEGDKEYRALTKRQAAIKQEITTRKTLLAEIEATADALAKEEQRLISDKAATEQNAKSKGMLRTQLMNAKNALAEMEEAGQRGTKAFRDLQIEVGRLQNAMGDANTQAKILSHDNAGLQGIISAVSGFTGAMSAAQGAVGLFADENENLQKIMVKVQSLMAITMGLQQVANTINKDSYFTIVTLGKAKQLLSTSTLFLGKAFIKMGLSATAAKIAVTGLYATLTMGLSLAITGIVHLISKYNQKQEEEKRKAEEVAEAHKKQQERLESLAKTYAEQVALITTLRNALNNETLSYSDKLKVIKKLQEIIPDYNAKISKEGDIIWENKAAIDAYLASLEKTLKFKAAMEDLTEIYKEIYQLEKNAPKEPAGKKTMTFNGETFDTWDVNELAKQHGLKDATDIPAHIIEQWKQQAEGFNDLTKEMHSKRMEELNGQVSEIQKYVQENNLIDITSGTKGRSGNTKDPYLEYLNKRKQTYQDYFRWVNAGLKKEANIEFAGLHDGGDTYLDFLQKQRQGIEAEIQRTGKKTGEQTKNLYTLNSQIAAETKETVLSQFENELQTQLKGANSIMEMLDVLEERRKALETDDSGLTNEKNDILNKQQENLAKQSETELTNATKAYKEYIDSKVNADIKYFNRKKELEEKIAQTTSDAQKKILQNQLEALNTLYDLNQTTDYDKLVEEYKTYQQKIADITKEYDEKIALATKNNNQQLVDSLTKAKNKALSSAALEELQNSGAWERLFSNLDDLTTKQIEDLIAKIEAQRAQLGIELDPKDLEAILNKLNDAKDEVRSRNPFKALLESIKEVKNELNTQSFLNSNDPFITSLNDKKKQYEEYKKWISSGNNTLVKGAGQAFDELLKEGSSYLDFLKRKRNELSGKVEITVEDRQAINALDALIRKEDEASSGTDTLSNKLKQMFKNSAASLDLVKGAFDSVVGGLADMGLAGDEVTQGLLGDISKMIGSASELATGIATGNPLSIIQGSIGLISSAFDVFNSRDRKAERAIKKHAEAVKELENAYTALAWAVDKALGETVYDNQKALVSNMRQQQAHLQEMWRNEESKKKTDKNKVKEYKQQYEELGRQIEDTIAEIAASITQTTAKDLANELADAIVEAFGKGEDAAKAFEETAKKVMQNAVKNALKLQFLEQPLQKAIAQLQKDMGFDAEGNGTFDGLTAAEQQRFKNSISAIGANFAEAMKLYEDLFKELEEDGDPTTSLSGAIKGASQESIDLLAGQTNAVRVNQVEGNEIMRSQLLHLASIDAKIGVSNSWLQQIEQNTRTTTNDPLRAQGIID